MNDVVWKRGRMRATLAWLVCTMALAGSTACSSDDADSHGDPAGAGGSGGDGGAGGDGGGEETTPPYALFVASNFDTTAEMAVVDLEAGTVAGRVVFDDQDTVPYASAGHGFALHRMQGSVAVLDPKAPWSVAHTVSVSDGEQSTNPYAAVVAAGDKAYVVRYSHNALAIIDVTSGERIGEVDLSGFVHPDDPDGFADAFDGVYDPATKRAYFVLGRVNQFTTDFIAPDWVAPCNPFNAAVVGIDTETNEILDLNGDDPGQLIELEGQNPNALVADFASDRLIVLHTGCYTPGATEEDEPARGHRGIEAVSLSSGSSTWLYESAEAERLSYLLWLGPERAYVGQGFPTAWHAWDPTEPTLGAVEAKIPELPSWDGERILGVASAEDGSVDAVAFDPDSGEVTTVAAGLFETEGLFSYGSAVLR